MRKPNVAYRAPAAADDARAKALRPRMEDPFPIGRTKPKLAALRDFCAAMVEADDLYDSDKAEAVSQAAHAAMELCHQLGIGHATRALMGLLYALEDRKQGRTTDWLKPEKENNRMYVEDRHAIIVAVATVQVLCDAGKSVTDACVKVSEVIGTPANEITGKTVENWRHRIWEFCSPETFAEILSRARQLDPEDALLVLGRRRFSSGG